VVPGNLNPKAPVMDLYPLALMHANVYRKLDRRTRDSKIVNTFDGRATDDAAGSRTRPTGSSSRSPT
jgi:hypothetical protein